MSNAQRALLIVVILVLLLAVPLGRGIMFTVDERELAVVVRFGEPVASYTEPGLKFKLPLMDEVRRLPKTYQFWTESAGEVLVDLPTADGKKIEVTPWAIWRITDPDGFIRVLSRVENAEARVEQFVRSEMRDVITSYVLAEVVRSTDRDLPPTFQVELSGASGRFEERRSARGPSASPKQGTTEDEGAAVQVPRVGQSGAVERIEEGRENIVQKTKRAVQERLVKTDEGDEIGRGIELVDVGIAKIDFVDAVREAAFLRLIAFMESIAQENEAEGERAKMEIVNQANAEVQQIEGEGKGESNKIRGEVEAEVIQMYADAIKETGEFYNFVRTLEAYKEAIGSNTRLILTTDSDMFKLLKSVPPVAPPPPDEASSRGSSKRSEAAPSKAAEKAPAEKPSP